MHIALVNKSTNVTETEARLMVAACVHQMVFHYCSSWGRASAQFYYAGSSEADVLRIPSTHAVMYLFDDADQAGALGYHTEILGRVIAKVFTKIILENGGTVLGVTSDPYRYSVSSTVSHELLELLGDPFVNLYAQGPKNLDYAVELCDPVEAKSYFVSVGHPNDGSKTDVAVSNFVLPAFFDWEAITGPFDFQGELSGAFTLSRGGYQIVKKDDGQIDSIWGEHYPEWKKDKSHVLNRISRRAAKMKTVKAA